uniref:Uncharacterized protein n=1 Tax=Panagrolaimus sp. PS1159 TaxID=55785 RepID=A0AC35FK71_9BILA
MSNNKILCFTPKCNDVLVQIIDVETFKENLQVFSFAKLEDLLKELPKLPLKNVKDVLFRFTANDTEEKSKLAKLLEAYYAKYNIPVFCCSWNSIFLSSILLACVAEHGENSFPIAHFCVILCDDDKISLIHVLSSKNLPKSQFGDYNHIISTSSIPLILVNEELVGQITESEVYITCQQELGMIPVTNKQNQVQKMVENILKSAKKVTIISKNIHDFIGKAIFLKITKLLGLGSTKYEVCTNGVYNCGIAPLQEAKKVKELNLETFNECLVKAAAFESIPFYEMVVCYEKFENLVFLTKFPESTMNLTPQTVEKFSISELGTSLIIYVDQFLIPKMIVRKDNKQIKNGVIIYVKEKTFSVETIKNGTLNDINLNEVPFAISIADNSVQIGEKALKLKDDRNSFVLTDILKFMTSDLSKLKTDPKWGFKVVKDKEGQILLEFDTFRGRRKSPPSFIFGLILKWAVSQAKENLGTMPDKIVIVTKLLDDVMKRHLMASCNCAKLNSKNVQFKKYKIVEVELE